MDKCPHCNGLLFYDYDEWGKYILCGACSREYNLDSTPRRLLFEEFAIKTGLRLTDTMQGGIIRV